MLVTIYCVHNDCVDGQLRKHFQTLRRGRTSKRRKGKTTCTPTSVESMTIFISSLLFFLMSEHVCALLYVCLKEAKNRVGKMSLKLTRPGSTYEYVYASFSFLYGMIHINTMHTVGSKLIHHILQYSLILHDAYDDYTTRYVNTHQINQSLINIYKLISVNINQNQQTDRRDG